MNLTQIKNGDFSSIVGNWDSPDGKYKGVRFTNNAAFDTYSNGPDVPISWDSLQEDPQYPGTLYGNVVENGTSFKIYFVPAGIKLQNSDQTRDRIWIVFSDTAYENHVYSR
jgi:hypothetical protein